MLALRMIVRFRGTRFKVFATMGIVNMIVKLITVLVKENADRETCKRSETGLKNALSTPEIIPLEADSNMQQITMIQP